MKIKYLALMIGILVIGIVLSQETIDNVEITPVDTSKIEVCYTYTLEDSVSEVESYKNMCRFYPKDLTNKCEYTRYGKPINCENILVKEINLDIENWYKRRLPTQFKTETKLKDVIVSYASTEASSLIGKEYDFMSNEFK